MATQLDPDSPHASTRTKRRSKRPASLQRRVVRLVLYPAIVVGVVMTIAFAGPQMITAVVTRQIAVSVQEVSIPGVTGLSALQKERQLSMAHLAQPSNELGELLAQRRVADKSLAAMRRAAGPALSLAPQPIKDRMATLTGYLDRLSDIRSQIDARAISQRKVYSFYNDLLDAATELFGTQARTISDSPAATGGLDATEMFRVGDLMSRSGSLVTAAYASGKFSRSDFLRFSELVGTYRMQLPRLTPQLQPDVRKQVRTLTASDAWAQLTSAENALLARGPWSGGVPKALRGSEAEWQSLTNQVSQALIDVAVAHAEDVSGRALSDANTQLAQSVAVLVVALAVVVGALFLARQRARLLVTSRLARLRDEARTLSMERLPRILEALRAGQRVDVATEMPDLDYGTDELGEVATAMNEAQRMAVQAAVKEAEARDGAQAMFLGIARRNQRPLRHVLMKLETWQQEEQDPARMQRWFELDHQVTQAQRNVENLIILGGGQPGRRWREPVALLAVLRQAISESKQYARVKLQTVPDVKIVGDAVAGTGHLIAELLDNALSFSSPHLNVTVRSEQVARGVAVEVEDRGIGMPPETLDRYNQLLREAPEFDVTELGDLTQLGFPVIARLAKNLGIQVELRSSPYGGVVAIVLLPNRMVVSSAGESADAPKVAEAPAAPPLGGADQGFDAATTAEFQIADIAAAGAVDAISAGAPTQGDNLPSTDRFPWLSRGEQRDEAASADGRTSRHGEPATAGPDHDPRSHRDADRLRGSGAAVPDSDPPSHRSAGRHRDHTSERGVRPAPAADNGRPSPNRRSGDRPAARRPPLPERRPQQHMVPQLRTSGSGQDERQPDDVDLRSPDEMRSRMAAFQRGTAAGRRESSAEPKN